MSPEYERKRVRASLREIVARTEVLLAANVDLGLVPVVEDTGALMATIPELGPLVGRCRDSDCAHAGEPGCAVIEADASIGAALARFRRLVASLAEPS